MTVVCKNFFLDIKKDLKLELFNKLLLTCKLLTTASFQLRALFENETIL